MKDRRTVTTTRTERRTGVQTTHTDAFERAGLTDQEAQVVRMRHGLSEPPEARLEQRGQDDEELKAKLALMEQAGIEGLRQARRGRAGVSAGAAVIGVDEARKLAIIDRLKRMS